MRGRPGSVEARAEVGVAARLVVDPLIDRDERLRHMPVGHGHRNRGPASRGPRRIEQAADRVRRNRLRQLGEPALGHPSGGDEPVLLRSVAGRQLVDVMQQGGERDDVRIDLGPGSREEARPLGCDEADTSRMGNDPVREVEGGKQQLCLDGGG